MHQYTMIDMKMYMYMYTSVDVIGRHSIYYSNSNKLGEKSITRHY